jgi:hypothetical protein
VFTARYALTPYIKQIRFVFKVSNIYDVTQLYISEGRPWTGYLVQYSKMAGGEAGTLRGYMTSSTKQNFTCKKETTEVGRPHVTNGRNAYSKERAGEPS